MRAQVVIVPAAELNASADLVQGMYVEVMEDLARLRGVGMLLVRRTKDTRSELQLYGKPVESVLVHASHVVIVPEEEE